MLCSLFKCHNACALLIKPGRCSCADDLRHLSPLMDLSYLHKATKDSYCEGAHFRGVSQGSTSHPNLWAIFYAADLHSTHPWFLLIQPISGATHITLPKTLGGITLEHPPFPLESWEAFCFTMYSTNRRMVSGKCHWCNSVIPTCLPAHLHLSKYHLLDRAILHFLSWATLFYFGKGKKENCLGIFSKAK